MNYRNTRIYGRSLDVVSQCQALASCLPRGAGYLADQVRRAASSIVLNFAEGCGKRSRAERQRYFDSAKASAYEVAAVADVATRLGFLDETQHASLVDGCDHLAAMLTRFER